ncbi:MAG: hypothetical protein IPP47_16270 [Bryobacterales bacterium]|nr:hypothetical protein [Bryobacterales bacterium]
MAARTIDRALNLDVALAGRRSRKPNEIWVEESPWFDVALWPPQPRL